jgi:hypothetical protein
MKLQKLIYTDHLNIITLPALLLCAFSIKFLQTLLKITCRWWPMSPDIHFFHLIIIGPWWEFGIPSEAFLGSCVCTQNMYPICQQNSKFCYWDFLLKKIYYLTILSLVHRTILSNLTVWLPWFVFCKIMQCKNKCIKLISSVKSQKLHICTCKNEILLWYPNPQWWIYSQLTCFLQLW